MDRLEELLRAGGGSVVASWSPKVVRRAYLAGALVRVLPGVYARPGVDARVAALAQRDPRAVLVGRAAAALTWWPDLPVPLVRAIRSGGGPHRDAQGFAWVRRPVPDQHIERCGGIWLTDAATTALDLIPELGGRAIDEALRRRAVRLVDLESTLRDLPRQRGNTERRRLLADSRDEPWSEAERLFHRILRGLRLAWPYQTNHLVMLATGRIYLDVGLPALRLAFEIDGRSFHASERAFVSDRERDLELALVGWRVHRFAATTLRDRAAWVAETVRRLVAGRAAELRKRAR